MIHKYKLFDMDIVLDVYSGAVHVVDDCLYDMLDYLLEPFTAEPECPQFIVGELSKKYPVEDIKESYQEICELVKNGQLFTDDCYEEFAKNWNKKSVVKALCLHIAHDCNLRCKYCFAGTGEYHGARGMMSAQTGKKAIDFVI
ncbi:MAG: thioether cross-link-forming SCIFF peptide maturase, partial [Candidatus Ornithomonoglobus sp.]